MDCIPSQYQEVRALRVRASGARGDEKASPIERMRGIVNRHDLWGVIE